MSIGTTGSRYIDSGAYAIVGKTGTMAAGLGAAAPIFSFRWASSTANAKAMIDRISVSVMSLGTGFTAGSGYIDAVIARAFTDPDTGGGTLTITGNNAKRRFGMDTTLLTEARISSTATLSAGTRTLDDNAFGAVQFGVSTATNTVHLATSDLWRPDPLTYPLMLTASEGIILRATVPATGTWQGIVSVEWREVLG